jgi:hypothetical protein
MSPVVTVKVPPEVMRQVMIQAQKERITPAELFRRALSLYLADGGSDQNLMECGKDCTRVFTFKVYNQFLNEIDLYAINHRIPRSQVVRNAIAYYLEKYGIVRVNLTG